MFSGVDVYRPSYFEMVAAERLVGGIKPALKHVCSVVARRHPALAPLASHSDSVFYALLFLLERHSLAQHDASFSEYFYGMRRVHVNVPLPEALARQVRRAEQYSAALFGAEAIAQANEHAKQAAAAAAANGAMATAAASSAAAPASSSSSSSSSSLPPGSTPFFRPLDDADRQRALFFLVALPWMKSRLDALFVRWRDGIDEAGFEEAPHDPQQHSVLYNLFRSGFMRVYPNLHALYEGAQLVAQLRFLFERSVFYSPWLKLQSQVVRRMNYEEMMGPGAASAAAAAAAAAASAAAPVATDALERAWPSNWPMRVVYVVQRLFGFFSSFVGRYAKYGVLLSILAFKFAEWWYSPANAYYASNSGGIAGGRKLPIPPPPALPKRAQGGIEVPADRRVCPLCRAERTNPAAAPSGYVFCYTCIHQHIQARRCCPITLRPCEVDEIRKIYEN